jgi:hypothetical protein
MALASEERRSEPRQAFDKIIQYNLTVKEKETDRLVNLKLTGVCIDISKSGMRLTSHFIIEKGLVLELSLPIDSTDVLAPVFAEVMWSKPEKVYVSNGLRLLHTA